MTHALAYVLPLALLAPAQSVEEARPASSPKSYQSINAIFGHNLLLQQKQIDSAPEPLPLGGTSGASQTWLPLSEAFRPDPQWQVRIQSRVIIRVAPRRPSRTSLVADTRAPSQATLQFDEKKIGKCVSADSIAGMQPNGNRLILFMRNRALVSARLNKKCKARDFYAGFYVERPKDGKLCIKRDELQSRAGSKCKLRSFRQLVPKSK